ncbi:DUF427 domain-containing protein [Allohahella sp. A8]|uniref:DUF427 domain-containing protein n=1 Tax=Allohahella sp. A8 TaxID=3141461 RepID=UPI000C0BAF31|nr:hypothetical protein [Hahellaceae bacterium]|tara:strand:- start:35751 stop:36032 length:282 start_codon:yes stop_codon:yes gene_type:complete
MKAIWKGQVIAESDDVVEVDGERYFPWDSLNGCYFMKSETTSTSQGRGEARYLNVVVEDQENRDAAWYYPNPKDKAQEIKDRVAFGSGVEVTA